MEVTFSDSFFKSLKKLNRQSTWWYKTYHFVRYGLPEFLKNIYRFRKELYNHRWWDYNFTLQMFKKSLEIQEAGMREKGIEESGSLNKKLVAMRRAIKIIDNILDASDNYMTLAEEKIGKKASWSDDNWDFFSEQSDEQKEIDREILELSHEMQQAEWKELWSIIKGKKYTNFESFDGSDLRGWWD